MMNSDQISWPGWETVRLVGRGNFGAVYEIQRKMFDDLEKAALKVISIPQNANDIEELYNDGYDEESVTSAFQSHLKSIVAEYSLMRKMNGCANIVNCDDVRYIQHDDGIGWDIFIKMELLTPLTKALTDKISEETVVKIAKDMCAALELCRKYDIIHRDIKPQNIFVSGNGDYKLGDFGIAKTVEKTMGGTKIGTYKYMAPEVYNNQPYGQSADIYSLGLVLYWLLNEKRMPFMPLPPAKLQTSMDEQARARRFSGEKIPAPANGSAELKRIVLKACAYKPADRYATAAEMLKELNAAFGDKSMLLQLEYEERLRKEREEQERLKKEAEERERLRREAEERERIRKEAEERERLQKEEQDRLEREAEEWLRNEAEKRERLRKETEERENLQKEDQEETREAKKHQDGEWKKRMALISGGIVATIFFVMLYFNVHIWEAATCTQAKTCKICGETEGDVPGHLWVAATCDNPEYCGVCGKSGASQKQHQWVEATCEAPKCCSLCQTTAGTPLGHYWAAGTHEGEWICIRCAISVYESSNETLGSKVETEDCVSDLGHYWERGAHEGEWICMRCAISIDESSSEILGPLVEAEPCTSSLGHCWERGTYEGEWICMRCAISVDEVTGP